MPLWKRSIDITFSVLTAPVLGIAALLIAILHRLYSPGPLFFLQERVGYRGKRFRIYKFRTMTSGTDTRCHQDHFRRLISSNAPMEKLDAGGDSRLIPGGWLLRATGLDELPQVINLLRGEMSLVGPRPCLPSEYANYLPAQRLRLGCTPGLTGLWQVSGKNHTTFEEMIFLDVKYVRTLSLSLDLRIVVSTFPALLAQVIDTRKARASPPAAARISAAPSIPRENPGVSFIPKKSLIHAKTN